MSLQLPLISPNKVTRVRLSLHIWITKGLELTNREHHSTLSSSVLYVRSIATIVCVFWVLSNHRKICRRLALVSDLDTTNWSPDLEGRACVLFICPFCFYFSFVFIPFLFFFYIIVTFENKDDGKGPNRFREVRYFKVTEGPPTTPLPCTTKAFQHLSLIDKAPLPV